MKPPPREWLGAVLARVLLVWAIAVAAILMVGRKPGVKHEVPPPPAAAAAPRDGSTETRGDR